eukprot:TRINITY_DN55951_c0_g1_i1.p1 TRINITY_DN55951_c0_g1~~TRINITY_DN55951_c0_g1_i1.p1  ORF type:complete len:934 (+),score=371.71 TRINITY_DN55951_c0_g1_i1:80-2803(+)
MPHSYLKYEPRGMTGVVAANEGNIAALRVADPDGRGPRTVVCTPALENVHMFDPATLEIVSLIPGGNEEAAVTCLQPSEDSNFLAVGYSDGHCSLVRTADWETLLQRGLGHKLTCRILSLAVTPDGSAMASGGTDCDIVWWDVPAQDPLFRLRGHKQAIVGLALLGAAQHDQRRLVSLGAEGIVRVWDPALQACVTTFVGSETQGTCLALDAAESRLIVGGRDETLRVWAVSPGEGPGSDAVAFTPHGGLTRSNHRPCAALVFNPAHTLLLCQSAQNVVELFRVLGERGVQGKLARQRKRKREAGKEDEQVERNAALEFVRLDAAIRTDAKIRSVCFLPQSASERRSEPDRIAVHLNDNRFQLWHATWTGDKGEPVTLTQARSCEVIGHRGEIRGSAMASSCRLAATCAVGAVKLWRIELEQEGEEGSIVDCTHTLPVAEPTCVAFLPGDQYIAAGTKDGLIEIHDLRRASKLEQQDAHKGEVTCLCLRSDLRGLASGGKDKQLRTWTFEVLRDAEAGGRRVGITPAATLELTDAVTACTYSPDNRFLAVALQDNTVKVFFADSHKFFLSLYGHKYPVTALSVSSDSRMIATASIDKNVKLWGLDFGDCHKSIFAHDDYVTDIKWVPGTHLFWTCGKDGLVKAWDGDRFIHIQTLKGHHGAVWSMEMSKEGGVLLTCGSDRSIRSWVRTEHQVFPEEEREREAQEAADKEAAASAAHAKLDRLDGELATAGERTKEHLKTSEQLMDTLDIVTNELERKARGEAEHGVAHPLVGTRSPYEFLGKRLDGIKGHEMRYTVSGLPLDHCRRLLLYCVDVLRERAARTEAVAKICLLVCRQCAGQVRGNSELRAAVLTLHAALHRRIGEEVRAHGFNLAGLEFLLQGLQERRDNRSMFFDLSLRKGHKKQRR